jgi:RNA polymerase sigma-70 factor (ECF subfamily)
MDPVPDPQEAPTDAALVTGAAGGDRSAFDRLVERHGAALFRFASRQCGAGADAEDAFQEGLLAAWRGAATFRGESEVRTWLFQIVLHACRRRRRRRSGEPAVHAGLEDAEALPSHDAGAESNASARQASSMLARALAALPDESREVLLLRDVEGLSGEEAAGVLGLSLAAMKSRLHRGRLELKGRVEALFGGVPGEWES